MSEERAFDPQRINLYAYVRNNPYKYVDSTGEDIDDSSLNENEDYQKWKKAFLATKDGQKLWDKYQNDKNFKLIINISKSKGNGAETLDYKFSDGKLVGATIVLGNKLDNVPGKRSKDAYPITQSLSEAGVDGTTAAVGKIAHEFGHVEDASNRPALFQAIQEYQDFVQKRAAEIKPKTVLYDSQTIERGNALLKKSGFGDFKQLDADKDRRAEQVMIPVIQQHFNNNGKKTPETVQKAIDNFKRY